MHDKDIYEYAIIRLVPRVERGEFINIGVILLAKYRDYIGMRYHLDKDRITALWPEVDLELISSYLAAWERVAAGGADGGKIGERDLRFRYRWLTANRSTILQASPVHVGRSSDPERTVEELMDRYVLPIDSNPIK